SKITSAAWAGTCDIAIAITAAAGKIHFPVFIFMTQYSFTASLVYAGQPSSPAPAATTNISGSNGAKSHRESGLSGSTICQNGGVAFRQQPWFWQRQRNAYIGFYGG